MKKKVLRKKTRQYLTGVLIFLIVFSLTGLCWSFTRPSVKEEEYQAFSYSQEANIDYRVNLLPNELFDEPALGPGRAYISSLTDTIDTNFTYQFSSQQEAEIKGEYSVVASLEAVTGPENHAVWEKNFILHPPESFYINGKEAVLQKNILLPFSQYYAYAEEIIEKTGFSPEILNLNVSCNVTLTANTPDGALEEAASPQMIIPLKGKVFTVGGNLQDIKDGEITAVRQLAVPYFEEAKIGFGLFAILLVLFLLITMQMTVAREEKNKAVRQKLSRILKKYQDRVVKCSEEIPILNQHNVLMVSSFEDMVKAADELERPILYFQTKEESEHSFFVISEQYVYRYNLGEFSSFSANNLPRKHLAHLSK